MLMVLVLRMYKKGYFRVRSPSGPTVCRYIRAHDLVAVESSIQFGSHVSRDVDRAVTIHRPQPAGRTLLLQPQRDVVASLRRRPGPHQFTAAAAASAAMQIFYGLATGPQ